MRSWARPVAIIAVVGMVLAIGLVVVLQLTNRGEPLPDLPEPTAAADDPVNDPRFAQFFDQEPSWESCHTDKECTKVTVPVDWSDPEGATLGLAVVRAKATSNRLGALLMNPGGPGSSGVSYVGDYLQYIVTSKVAASYDVVGFDPRGVGDSSPIDCVPDSELDGYLFDDLDPETPDGWANYGEIAKQFAAGCQQGTGELLEHVDTISAARDMDVIRAVVDDDRLNFLGKSYGTLLGATYAGLFPNKVGHMVLDGAIDPRLDSKGMSLGQAKGMEVALESYLDDCLESSDCPFEGSVADAKQRIQELFDQAEANPIPTGDPDRPLTGPRASTGVITPLYAKQQWPVLTEAFRAAFQGDGAKLLAQADAYSERQPDGSYGSNLMEAFTAINCLDYQRPSADLADAQATAERVKQEAPTFGRYLSFGEQTCAVWPHDPVRTGEPITAEGAPPILVVGTRNDNATPYPWAEALAEQLSSGVLITYEGDGHTAYRSAGSRCIDAIVDDYLVRNTVPEAGDETCNA